MFIFAQNITSRHLYVSKILEDRLGVSFNWVSDKAFLENEKDVFIYDSKPHDGFVCIFSEGLLDELVLRTDLPKPDSLYFPAPDGFSFDFDVFSALFFVITRYEEYLDNDKDAHGRYKAENSLQTQLNILDVPIVDEWIFSLGSLLEKQFDVKVVKPKFRFTPTFDVDVAYAYLGRPFWLTLGGYLNDFKKKNFVAIKNRFRVNTGLEKDPYDAYGTIKDLCLMYKTKPSIFFQVGTRGAYDKNLYPFSPLMRELIADTAKWADVGLHPSYASNSNVEILKTEKKQFEQLIDAAVTRSRQHYLKFELPQTYKQLISLGIEQEFSMGYSTHVGFRAGTCHAFPFFDLNSNKSTKLIIRPFAVMDGTLKDNMLPGLDAAKENVEKLINVTKQNSGEFIFIWHNSSLSEIGEWENWLEVLTHLFKAAYE